MQRARFAIVGLGIAGTTAALLLARQGHEVTVFEQAASPGPVGAGVLLQPSGQLVLERLGLMEKVAALAEPIERLFACTHRGKTLIDLPYGELGAGIEAYGIHRGGLFGVLHEELRGTAAVMRLGVRATRYENYGTYVRLLDEGGAVLGDFDFLLACDGAQSALRRCARVSVRVHEYPHGAVWAVGKCGAIRGKLLQVTHGSKRMCGLLPMAEGRCSLFWSLAKVEYEAFMKRGFAAWREEVEMLCPSAAEIFGEVRSFDEIRYTTYLHVRMKRAVDGRCLFLGDAAHAMSPHLGQGINLALLDAHVLAEALAGAEDFAAGCERWHVARREHIRVYSAVTYMLSPFFQSRGYVTGALRDIFLPWMPRFGPLRRQMIVTMAGLRAGWSGGRLTLEE